MIETSRLSNAVAQFGKAKGAVVGRDRATVTIVSPTALRLEGVAKLPGGTVAIGGPITAGNSTDATIPVTGGTGRYVRARGTVLVRQLGPTQALNVYRLTLP